MQARGEWSGWNSEFHHLTSSLTRGKNACRQLPKILTICGDSHHEFVSNCRMRNFFLEIFCHALIHLKTQDTCNYNIKIIVIGIGILASALFSSGSPKIVAVLSSQNKRVVGFVALLLDYGRFVGFIIRLRTTTIEQRWFRPFQNVLA